MSRKLFNPDLKILRSFAMENEEFIAIIESCLAPDFYDKLRKKLSKLSYKKLLAYELRFRFRILDYLDHINFSNQNEPNVVPLIISAIYISPKSFMNISLEELKRIEHISNMDELLIIGDEIYWEKFVLNNRNLRDNPCHIANSIIDFWEYTDLKPSWYRGA